MNCFETNPVFLEVNELFGVVLKLFSHLKKSQPDLDAALCLTEQLKKNRPVFCPGDCTILLFDLRPQLHRGGVHFMADPTDGVLKTDDEFTLEFVLEVTGDGVLNIAVPEFVATEFLLAIIGEGVLNTVVLELVEPLKLGVGVTRDDC